MFVGLGWPLPAFFNYYISASLPACRQSVLGTQRNEWYANKWMIS
jgi:hypothetical protein